MNAHGEPVSESESSFIGGKKQPRVISYIEDRKRRNTTFSKRKKSIISKTHEISLITGCSVFIAIKSGRNCYCFGTNDFETIASNEGATFVRNTLKGQAPVIFSTEYDNDGSTVQHTNLGEVEEQSANTETGSGISAAHSAQLAAPAPGIAAPLCPEPHPVTIMTEMPTKTATDPSRYARLAMERHRWIQDATRVMRHNDDTPDDEAMEHDVDDCQWLDEPNNEEVALMALIGERDGERNAAPTNRPNCGTWGGNEDHGINALVFSSRL
ncbi:SRF-type transcription factor (DNA-binding and dimerization domain) [Carpediemonas membranifera]|uniref:SRF-type transcription factor (DNA-binding and dimerization domain) n=1 Tax=Carpediemonas membranifera TaxID=201153 RepID=A0A8J6E176_9EUKA|nr:SRF-type transcription factor (DNA-binding and dimerization domain) [Carpediemonas membranifera]|eukprot:KAG9390277.1 SRF-type transcription factor (DNA-binding and dimerization domain) [Carpediemonas membranifera]